MQTSLPYPSIEQYLPHRLPFRFVDSIKQVDETSGEFSLLLEQSDKRLIDGVISPLLLVEALAQSAAAFHGIAKERAGAKEPESGMLVQIDSAQFLKAASSGFEIGLRIERTHELGALVRFKGAATQQDEVLVEAVFTVARNPEGDVGDR